MFIIQNPKTKEIKLFEKCDDAILYAIKEIERANQQKRFLYLELIKDNKCLREFFSGGVVPM